MTNGIISEEMKSRLIKAGLPATYEELIILAATTGIPADILINEEGWAQFPTYLSKANLMDDVTEEAIWGDAADRTVNAALKMLADVAYGRVATLNLTVLDTTGAPIPDVTVKLDSPPVVGTDPRTDEDGKITISTNGGEHTLYLVYPMGFTVETANQTVQVSGTLNLTVNDAVRRANTYVYKITSSKTFYIARHLSPVKLDLRGGGASGAVRCGYMDNGDKYTCQGGAGGYQTLVSSSDVAGKLIRVTIGASGASVSASSGSASGRDGGTTTVYVGDTRHTAAGGTGGKISTDTNTGGGAAGGGGTSTSPSQSNNGEDGLRLFGESGSEVIGGGGGGAYLGFPSMDTYVSYAGDGGSPGGTDGAAAQQGLNQIATDDAKISGGSGGCAVNRSSSSGSAKSGKGGTGLVAFKKAV